MNFQQSRLHVWGLRTVKLGLCLCMVLLSIQPKLNAQKDMGYGYCAAHGNYKGSSCPTCASGNSPNPPTPVYRISRADKKAIKATKLANEAYDAYKKGVDFLKKGDCANAIIAFQESVDKDPNDPNTPGWLTNAKACLAQQQKEQQERQQQQQSIQQQQQSIQQNKIAVTKMQQSIQAFTQTLNTTPTTGGLDFDGQNNNAASKGNGLDFIAANNEVPTDKIVKQEQDEFDKMNAAWMVNQKKLIEQRLQEPNKWCNAIYNSLKINEPPLPFKKFSELQPGDVLLIASDGILGDLINGADRLTSGNQSTAAHTVLYLKEVNGKKLFLDNTPGMSDATNGRGPHILNEEQFMKIYGQRDADVAKPAVLGVAQPLNEEETAKLWAAAHKLSIQELKSETSKSWNFLDKTDYGLWGNKNMVCSEASRWALVSIGRKIPETESPLKKLMGVNFGPADFYKDVQNFIVSPLGIPHSK